MILREWQREFIRNVYDPVGPGGRRRVRRALLSIARKNGKTALAAALVLVHLVGPEAKMNGEVYSAASDRAQAGHIYKMAAQMVALDPELQQLCKPLDSIKRIVCYHLGSFYVSLSADARRQHGFNPTFVIYDELAQALDREMFDVLTSSFGAQPEGLFLAISTQSSDPLHVMSEMADDAIKQAAGTLDDPSFYGKVYAVPDDADPYDESVWHLANPALDDFRDLGDMRAFAAKAKRSPAAEAAFKNLYLNQRVDGTQAFVNSIDWRACGTAVVDEEELAGLECYGGLDLSSRHDLCALALVFPRKRAPWAVRMRFWLPKSDITERERRDGAPYRVFAKDGHLTLLEGRSLDYARVALDLQEVTQRYNVVSAAFDRWRIEDLKRELFNIGLDERKLQLVPYGQGFKDMSPAIEALETAVLEHTIAHANNPLLTYCMSNVSVFRDPAGNRKFDKRSPNKRIDGAVALAMALGNVSRTVVEPKRQSVYEGRGLRVI
jgi:phage terminase large subunit-like protein